MYLDYLNEISEKCIGCNICSKDCLLLKEIGPIKKLVRKDITEEMASACMSCGLCESVCPMRLSPMKLLYDVRVNNVKGRENQIVSLTSPDREKTTYDEYREFYNIDYKDILIDSCSKSVFFPGCVISSYLPNLARKLFDLLKEKGICDKMWLDCCTRNFTTYGCLERADSHANYLITFAKNYGIERIVTACINCYNSLVEVFKDTNIEVVSIYNLLDFQIKPDSYIYTVHDSCPDRTANGLFSKKSREYLINNGFHVIEMKHNRNKSICCGNGGGAQHIRPQYSQKYVEMRLNEAKEINADVIVVYCPLCGMKYINNPYGIKVRHILDIMLGIESEMEDAKIKMENLFAGEDGKERKKNLLKCSIVNDVKSL